MALAPEYQAMFDQLAENGPAPGISDLPVPDGRNVYRAMRPVNPDLPVHKIEDLNIDGPLGEIPVRVYHPLGMALSGFWCISTAAAGSLAISTLRTLSAENCPPWRAWWWCQ